MNKEDYVSFEVAKLLREKGFDLKCNHYWWQHNNETRLDSEGFRFTKEWLEVNNDCYEGVWLAPTLYEAAKWLRKTHDIHIVVSPHYSRKYEIIEYEYRIATYFDLLEKQGKRIKSKEYYEKYEQCLNNTILEALKLINC